MMHTYVKSETDLYTVGYFKPDGKWQPLYDFDTASQAASYVNYLNGGKGDVYVRPRD